MCILFISFCEWVALHGLHYMGSIAWVNALHKLHCMGCIEWVTLHGCIAVVCLAWFAWIAYILHCMCCHAYVLHCMGSGLYSGELTWSIVLRCDDHTGIFTCNGCARDPYFYVPAETQSYVIKLSCSRKVLAASGD